MLGEDISIAGVGEILEQFILSSPLGEFAARLHLLHSFHGQLKTMAASGIHQAVPDASLKHWRQLSAVLHNIKQFYVQFSPGIAYAISEGLRVLEKELQVSCRMSLAAQASLEPSVLEALYLHDRRYAGLCVFGKLGGSRLLCHAAGSGEGPAPAAPPGPQGNADPQAAFLLRYPAAPAMLPNDRRCPVSFPAGTVWQSNDIFLFSLMDYSSYRSQQGHGLWGPASSLAWPSQP